jgi:hypothetical protein
MRRLILILALLAVASAAPAAIVAVETVEYPVEAFWAAMDASFDGSRLVANFGGDIWLWEAGMWTHVDFGHALSPGVGISADGTAIISAQDDPDTGLRNPAIWYESNSWTDPTLLGGIPGYGSCDNSVGSGYALNHDGSIAVGLGWNDCEGVAFMWTAASGMVDIGGVRASMISDDGTVVTGFDHHPDWGGRRANYWLNDPGGTPPGSVTGPILMGDADDAPSEGYDITSDGSMICGEHFPADSGWFWSRAMVWTEATGIVELGTLGNNENHRSIAMNCSDDGKVCGVSGDPPPWGMWDVFLWTEAEGMQQLKQLCLDSGATLPDGFVDNNLVGVLTLSSDGSTLLVTWQDDMWNQGAYKITFESTVAIDGDEQPGEALPQAVSLKQNYPNPFNPMTNIAFTVPRAEHVKLAIYDAKGRHVRTVHDGTVEAGEHTVVWDGTDGAGRSVSSGTYVYRLITDSRVYHRTMTIAK